MGGIVEHTVPTVVIDLFNDVHAAGSFDSSASTSDFGTEKIFSLTL
jgi:hypothetical protein